jgi:hypothetical protein
MTFRAIAFLCVLQLAGVANAGAQARRLSVAEVVRASRDAVVVLRVLDEDGERIGLGSGFMLPDGRIATNSHVGTGAARVEVVNASGQLLLVAPFVEAISTQVDLAVLPGLRSPTRGLRIASKAPEVGEAVVVIGAPEGLSNTVTDGIVSALRDLNGQKLLQISAPISPGSSGGPVLNLDGEVIGVAVAFLRDGQNLNFAVPAADLSALVNSPASRIAFPSVPMRESGRPEAASEKPAVESGAARGDSSPEPVDVQAVGHFRVYAYGCVRDANHSGVGCAWRIANEDGTGRANTHYYIQGSAMYAGGIKAITDQAALGNKEGRIGGLNMLDETIAPGTNVVFIAHYPGIPTTATTADIQVNMSVGLFGAERQVWFRGIPIFPATGGGE